MAVIGATNQFVDQTRKVIRGEVSAPLPKEVREMFDSCASRGTPQVRDLMAQFQGFAESHDDMNLTPANLATIKARTLIVRGDRDEFFRSRFRSRCTGRSPDRSCGFQRVTRQFLAAPTAPAR